MRRTLLLLVVALATAGAPARAADGPPPRGLGVRLLDAPTDRADDPRARVYVVDQVKPGATFVRHVEVSNGDAAAMDVVVYPATATVRDGGFEIGSRNDPGAVPEWTSVTPTSLHLEPGSRRDVVVTVRVPQDAPAGEVYGGIVAERPAGRSGATVSLALRAAVRVYLSVGPGGEPASDFRVTALTAARDKAGKPVVRAEVENTGGRALDMSGTLRLTDGPGGLSAGPFAATLGTTLGIGQRAPVAVVLDPALPAGPWKARLELESGRVKHAVEAVITFPEGASAVSPPVTPEEVPLYEKEQVVVPVAAVLIGVVAAALLLLALQAVLRRRRRAQ